jgi:hypothetical protein
MSFDSGRQGLDAESAADELEAAEADEGTEGGLGDGYSSYYTPKRIYGSYGSSKKRYGY